MSGQPDEGTRPRKVTREDWKPSGMTAFGMRRLESHGQLNFLVTVSVEHVRPNGKRKGRRCAQG